MPDWLSLQWQLIRPYGRQLYYSLFPRRRPAYFEAPWSYPPGRLATPAPDRPVCLFLPMTDWHARLQRSQQLAACVAAAGCQAVYVNPHLGLEYRRPYLFDAKTRLLELAPRLFELHIHLAREHELHRRAFTMGESRRIAREIAAVGVEQAAIVVSFPAWLEAAEQLRARYGCPIVYDCHDWLPGFCRTAPELLEREGLLFRAADAVVFSSEYLRDRVLERHPVGGKSLLIRNAVEPFDPPGPRVVADPPTIGYVGALDHWFDVDAVAAVAEAHPEWRVVLAGRVEWQRVLELRRFANVAFLGGVARAEVPAMLRGWSAAMIPFTVNELTLAANPIKLYEYFAAGLPVVSTRLPEVERYGDLAYIADGPAEFAALAAQAVAEHDDRRERRIAAGAAETWPVRAGQLLDCVRSLMRPAGPPRPRA
jgi:glycosyltransferase involved in cell wall biosynthesis